MNCDLKSTSANLLRAIIATFLVIVTGVPVASSQSPENSSLEWIDLEQAQKEASGDGKTIMVFVEAEWCGFCQQMKREVFPKEVIRSLVQEYYHAVAIDLESRQNILFNGKKMTEREFARMMQVSGTPTILFINAVGEVLAHNVGYSPEREFELLLNFIHSDEFGQISFEEYSELSTNR